MSLKDLLAPPGRAGPWRSRLVLGLALAATLAAMASVSEPEGEAGAGDGRERGVLRAPADGRGADASPPSGAEDGGAIALHLDKLKRPAAEPGRADLFASKSWFVPPPPPPPPPPVVPPPPRAPPLPFTYLGQLREAPGQEVVFLVKGDRLYTVAPGDVIDGLYRVDGISAGRLELTYLPLNIRQSLTLGDLS